ncbi:hypothetical protein [Paraclostridium sordellii]|nr:hypothetical protein [Paeniclostridium sordellii]EPZ62525.1 hypothetical protein H476_3436 [[Clostridium] sordellii VPI 9048] [Paeniclostridium sordellii VPI 9048]
MLTIDKLIENKYLNLSGNMEKTMKINSQIKKNTTNIVFTYLLF